MWCNDWAGGESIEIDGSVYKTISEKELTANRFIFGRPVRYTTLDMYPGKLNLETFIKVMEDSLPTFKDNMVKIDQTGYKNIEEWAETLLAWMEIEEER